MQNKVRIIVGPNGSGKSSIKKILVDELKLNFGTFINADDIQKKLNNNKSIENSLNISQQTAINFFENHTLNKRFKLNKLARQLIFDKKIKTSNYIINPYEASAIADLFREQCVINKISFSYETVFSDPSKINFVEKLKNSSYQIYVYVVCTLNPEINKSRVKFRMQNKGHSVPAEKIEERYYKSLNNIKKIIPYLKRTFIIDNSQHTQPLLVAELENGKKTIYLNKTYQPIWVKNLLS